MVRATTDIETVAMFLQKWATQANGHVRLAVYPKTDFVPCKAEVYQLPQEEYTYLVGSIDQVLHDVDTFLEKL